MLSLKIVDTDAFLEMPQTSQLLYFHLTLRADDEGFVGNPKKIMRMCGFGDDDLKVLLAKRFLLKFDSGVVVIKHWLIHNTIRMDRFNPTTYKDEKSTLYLKENKAYTDNWQPIGNQLATQVKLSKVKLSKDNIYKSLKYLLNIPLDDIKEFSDKFNCYEKLIKSKADDLYNYCKAHGKYYKNYKALLRNAIKKDFGERPDQDEIAKKRIEETQKKFKGSSQFSKELINKFKIN